jgi:hypothetical protein
MPYYYVTGKLWVQGGCNCPECDDEHIYKSAQERHATQAMSPELAADTVLEKKAPELVPSELALIDYGWDEPPSINEIPEDQVMSIIGAPTLFDLGGSESLKAEACCAK